MWSGIWLTHILDYWNNFESGNEHRDDFECTAFCLAQRSSWQNSSRRGVHFIWQIPSKSTKYSAEGGIIQLKWRLLMGEYTLHSDRAISPINLHLNHLQHLFSVTAAVAASSPTAATTATSHSSGSLDHQPQMNMQDESFAEKAAVNMKNQLSPNSSDLISDQGLEDSLLSRKPSGKENGESPLMTPNGAGDDKAKNGVSNSDAVNSVITSLNQLGLSEPIINSSSSAINSLPSSSAPSFWSTGSAEDTFVQGFPNGAVTFPNFPPSGANGLFNMSPHQMGLMSHPHRRAITGGQPQQQQNFQQRHHPGIFLNNTKASYQPWSNGQQSSWSQQQPPQSSPWGSSGNSGNLQRRSMTMPNVAPAAMGGGAMKKPPSVNPSMLISPSKYRRSTSFPGQYRGQQGGLGGKSAMDFGSLDDQRDGLLGLHSQVGTISCCLIAGFKGILGQVGIEMLRWVCHIEIWIMSNPVIWT